MCVCVYIYIYIYIQIYVCFFPFMCVYGSSFNQLLFKFIHKFLFLDLK